MMNSAIAVIGVLCALLIPGAAGSTATADEWKPYVWQSTNVQALRGWDYELGPDTRTIFTLEHASGWSVGDLYTFCDLTLKDDTSGSDVYCEITPRVSLSKAFGAKVSSKFLKDVLLAAQTEISEHGVYRYNYGVGVDLRVPHFKFFKVNAFRRNNPDREDQTYQIYMAWNLPIDALGQKFVFEGFADFFGDEGTGFAPSQLTQPRFLFDAGHFAFGKPGKVFIGVEYQYWHNKFGIDGVDESLPQAQIKAVF